MMTGTNAENEPEGIVSEDSEGNPPEGRLLRWADQFFAVVAGTILFCMMAMTFMDVVGRYFFNTPLGFAYEMTQVAMAAVVFCALPSVTLRRQHITAGLFENIFSGRAKIVRDVVILVVIAIACLFLAWRLSSLAGRFITFGDVTSVLRFPIGYVVWLGVAGLVLAAAMAVAAGSAILRREMRGEKP